MNMFVNAFATVAATLLATTAFAESAREHHAPSALAPIENEPAPR